MPSKSNLSSDILEQQFGPTAIEVLYQDAASRVICTKTVSGEQVLELSYVSFMPVGTHTYPTTHQTVMSGQSMGKAFRTDGITFTRTTQAVFRYRSPDSFRRWFGSNNPVTVVAVTVCVGADATPYARIWETYSPQVAWPDMGSEPTGRQLALIQEIWQRITDACNSAM